MKVFLKIKHWQLFILLVGFPIIFQVIAMTLIILRNEPTIVFYYFPIMMLLLVGIFFGWLYALGVNLYRKLPVTATMNLTKFKIFLVIPVTYMLSISVFMTGLFSGFPVGRQLNPGVFAIIALLHLFSMFCIFYCLYFTSKVLKTVELQRTVTFGDFVGEFFLIWFFPVGVWLIQPRINKLFDKSEGLVSSVAT